jgi:hypothetical protein
VPAKTKRRRWSMERFAIKETRVGVCCVFNNTYCRVIIGECEYGCMNRIIDYCGGPDDWEGFRKMSVQEFIASLDEKELKLYLPKIENFINEYSKLNSDLKES